MHSTTTLTSNPEAHKRRKERLGKPKSGNNHVANMDSSENETDGENHVHGDESLSDTEPGFSDGKKNSYRYPVCFDLQSNDSSTLTGHHLALFDIQEPLTKSARPGSSCTRGIPLSPQWHGSIASAVDPSTAACMEAIAVDSVTERIMDPESDLVNDSGSYASNDITPVV